MAKTKKIDPVEHQKSLNESAIRDFEKAIKLGILRKPPRHRKFKIGERVSLGAHKECYVREKYHDGYYYRVECLGVKRGREGEVNAYVDEMHVTEWHNIHPFETKDTGFRQEEKYYIRQINSAVDSLIHICTRAGIDFDVEYQREHVWTIKDKVSLIDSIFNNIDIGKIVLVQRDYSADVFYEVLDGKQRITAIRDFYEDRFKYNGYYYSELSRTDKHKFGNHAIALGYLENPDKHAIFESFIKLNTCGKPMAKKHIDHVQKLLDELGD
mgnify:CR=1 FL=1